MSNSLPTTTILNIDDGEAKRYTVSRVLRRAGFSVTEAATGTTGLNLVASAKPDLIVLDVKLPDISGFDICRRLKSDPVASGIPLLMLSATLTESSDRTLGLDYGADGYLTYPVESHELVATIHSLLRLSRAESRAREAAEEWRATFEAITDIICVLDAQGIIVRANAAAQQFFNRTEDLLAGQEASTLIAEILGEQEYLLPYAATSELERTAAEFQTSDRAYQISTDRVGATGGIVLIISEITTRRKMEEALAASYEKDRRIAKELQSSFLVNIPETAFPNLATDRFYEPAWDEASVGGDYYDSFELTDGSVVLVVGDATGKGLAAAARTAEVKFGLRAFAHEHREPAIVLDRLNNFLCAMHSGSNSDGDNVVALALAIVSASGEELCVAVAGAEPPLLLRNGSPPTSIVCGGLPLGVFPNHDYKSVTCSLSKGDTLVLVTDGITEARKGRDFLGYEGLTTLAVENAHEQSINTFGRAIIDGARTFAGGKFQDDVCVLVARRR